MMILLLLFEVTIKLSAVIWAKNFESRKNMGLFRPLIYFSLDSFLFFLIFLSNPTFLKSLPSTER